MDAVGKTSVTLSVKQRIAEGLSRAGTSNTLKVVSYNAILGIISFFTVGAVRQFCVFAIVVLVAHWFLAHTFFMAVLSIDIARLEVRLYINIKVSGLNLTILFYLSSARRTAAARHQLSAFCSDCSKRWTELKTATLKMAGTDRDY